MNATGARAALLLCLLLSGGCGTTPRTHYYVLSATAPEPATVPVAPVSLGIGPITIATYLDRSQITLRQGNALLMDPFHHWGEPLETGVARVLYEDLAARLGAQNLVRFPWRSDEIPGRQLRVRVLELNRTGTDAVLVAEWALLGDGAGGTTRRGQFRARTPVSGDGYEALAAAYSTLLQQLSANLAARVMASGTRFNPTE